VKAKGQSIKKTGKESGKGRDPAPVDAELRRRAEARLPITSRKPAAGMGDATSAVDVQRLFHELQVHQIELEMQNAELQESRDRLETLLEQYSNLYDFAPVGYFSLDDQGRILGVNLSGSVLLGMERSRLLAQTLARFIVIPSRPVFREFLRKVFAEAGKQVCEVQLLKEDGTPFWASLHGDSALSGDGSKKECRVAVSDITSFKLAQDAQRSLETLTVSNLELEKEILRRQAVEDSLKKSELHQRRLLKQACRQEERLRKLSHRILQTREDEQKRISRELHDVITQILVGIKFSMDSLGREATVNPQALKQRIAQTQRLVEKSVEIVHRFAVELRPTSLDDLGLIATLKTFLNDFMKRTGIRVHFKTVAGVDQLSGDQRTAIYRIVQAAFANVSEHAHASHVTVDLGQIADAIQLEIFDNGKAFDVKRTLRARTRKPLGLIGMRERVEMLGGQFAVESTPGKGTTIRVQIPLSAPPGKQ